MISLCISKMGNLIKRAKFPCIAWNKYFSLMQHGKGYDIAGKTPCMQRHIDQCTLLFSFSSAVCSVHKCKYNCQFQKKDPKQRPLVICNASSLLFAFLQWYLSCRLPTLKTRQLSFLPQCSFELQVAFCFHFLMTRDVYDSKLASL